MVGQKVYEMANHLGNVLVTVTDGRFVLNSGSNVTGYTAVVRSAMDYSAFGAPLANRSFSSNAYRYSMNGQEKDEELGSGVTTAEFWMYDAKLARRWNVDPVVKQWSSCYAILSNSPIVMVDPKGNTDYYNKKGKWIGTDGIDNGQSKIALEKSTVKTIKQATKQGLVISMNEYVYRDIIDAPTVAETNAMKNAWDKTVAGVSGNTAHEEGFVSGDGKITVSAPGKEGSFPNIPPIAELNTAIETHILGGSQAQLIVHTHPPVDGTRPDGSPGTVTTNPSPKDIEHAAAVKSSINPNAMFVIIGLPIIDIYDEKGKVVAQTRSTVVSATYYDEKKVTRGSITLQRLTQTSQRIEKDQAKRRPKT
jgi:RHS repeat-associated protein